MFAFALLISILASVVFGLAPAIQSTKSDLFLAIREGARGSGDSTKTSRLRDGLIVSQLTFAVVMMVGARLLLRTFWELLQVNPGFNPARVVAAASGSQSQTIPRQMPITDLPRKRLLLGSYYGA